MRPSYPRDLGNYKESAACPITKASNCSHFHIPLFFPAIQYQRIFSLFDTFSFRQRDRVDCKESAACPITKASNCSHFHTPLMFLLFTFTAIQHQSFCLFLIPLLILEMLFLSLCRALWRILRAKMNILAG